MYASFTVNIPISRACRLITLALSPQPVPGFNIKKELVSYLLVILAASLDKQTWWSVHIVS